MDSHIVHFLGSAAQVSQWPDSSLPELLFAGRSNAGKSTLINALVNRKNMAYTGKTPGKTVLLNFFEVDGRVVFTDAPGYGYAEGGTRRLKDFGVLLEPYFNQRKQLAGVILVLDSRRTPNEDDLSMIAAAQAHHLPVLAACTKADKLSHGALDRQLQVIARTGNLPRMALIPVSGLRKTGLDRLWEEINRILAQP